MRAARLIGGVAFGLLLFMSALPLGGCQSLGSALAGMEKPGAKVVGANLTALSTDGVGIDFDVDVSNPYAVDLPIVGIDYAIASSGASLLSGTSNPQGSIPAKGHRVVTLPTRIRFADALKALSGVKPGAVVPYRADLKLSMDAPAIGTVSLPVSHEGQLPIPAAPEVKITDLKWEELSLNRAAATVTMNVKNTNQFAAGLSRVSYELTLGGLPVGSGMVKGAGDVQPGAKTDITIPVSFSPASLGLAALEMLGRGDLSYGLRGGMSLTTPFGQFDAPMDAKGSTKTRN